MPTRGTRPARWPCDDPRRYETPKRAFPRRKGPLRAIVSPKTGNLGDFFRPRRRLNNSSLRLRERQQSGLRTAAPLLELLDRRREVEPADVDRRRLRVRAGRD